MYIENNDTPGSPFEWYELGVSLRRNEQFGEAINAFRKAEGEAARIMEEYSGLGYRDDRLDMEELRSLRDRASASIELILRIRGFVNKDLMNP